MNYVDLEAKILLKNLILCPEHAAAAIKSINIDHGFRDLTINNSNQQKNLTVFLTKTMQIVHIKNDDDSIVDTHNNHKNYSTKKLKEAG